MKRLKRILWTLLALAFLATSWFWDKIAQPIRWLVAHIPLERLKAAVARWLDRLPPYPTLLVFLIPVIALEPGKIIALWLLAKHQWLAGIATYAVTDLLRLGLVAFLFKTCREKLLSIGWFATLYGWFLRAHEWAHAQVDPVKAAIRRALADAGLAGHPGDFRRKVAALWAHARSGGFSAAWTVDERLHPPPGAAAPADARPDRPPSA